MIELSQERVETILKEETQKTAELATILRAIYARYMNLYEKYFADIETLNDDKIAELNQYHEETQSLVKYYYMDIPQDVCTELKEFDDEHSANLLGPDWQRYLLNIYREFRSKNSDRHERWVKAEFRKKALEGFYAAMSSIFRQGFGTESKTAAKNAEWIGSLLFGKKEKD